MTLWIIGPTEIDVWIARELAGLLRFHTEFNVSVQRAIASNILGGFWFGLALFVLWAESARKGQVAVQVRILTTLFGTALALLVMLGVESIISWPPPVHYPGLQQLYIGLLEPNPNTSSFPSESAVLFASVASGVYSLRKFTGCLLWGILVVFVAIPRMFVGGHFLTDIIAGFLIAVSGYLIARHPLEASLIQRLASYLDRTPKLQLFREIVVFIWIIQVTVEFQGVVWLRNVMQSVTH